MSESDLSKWAYRVEPQNDAGCERSKLIEGFLRAIMVIKLEYLRRQFIGIPFDAPEVVEHLTQYAGEEK